ncbi:hypothetical protein BH11MYX4_BH11MYX4_67400 [soil metagenome]
MKLPWSRLCWLFLLGAVVSPLGDHGHITTGTTAYLSRAVPFVWDSPLWFLVMVGLATAALADLRLRLGVVRPGVTWRDGVIALASLLAVYAVTALLRHQPLVPATLLVGALTALATAAFGDRPGILCGVAAAVGGVTVEAAMITTGFFKYADELALLAGVAPWTPLLYFCFGVVAARLGELAATTPSIRILP